MGNILSFFPKLFHFGHASNASVAIAGPILGIAGMATGPAGLIVGGMAVSAYAVLIWHERRKERDGGQAELPPELISAVEAAPDWIKRIVAVLGEDRNSNATSVLNAKLDELMGEPDWAKVMRRLDSAVEEWCKRQRSRTVKEWCKGPWGRKGEELQHNELRDVLLSFIRNWREGTYRARFADHYRRLENSVDPRDDLDDSSVDDVFVRLRVEQEPSRQVEQNQAPEYLDFQGKGPGDIESRLCEAMPRPLESANVPRNLVILGEPGSGKSTLLRHLGASCAQSESAGALLPVFLPLRKYASGQENIIADSAVAFAEDELQIHLPDRFFEDALDRGSCLVCLDALDEVPAAEERRRVVRGVRDLLDLYPKSRFIVTSRLAGYDETPLPSQRFTRCVVQPMDDAGVEAFIVWRFGDGLDAQNLRDVLDANPNIKSLVSNPLLMAMLNLVHQNAVAGLPLNRAKFYEQAVEILIAKGGGGDQTTHKALLTATALDLHEKNVETILKPRLLDLASDFLLKYRGKSHPTPADRGQAYAEAESLIKRAERRTGLFVEQDSGSGVFRFVHATFREYLTAQDIHARHRNYSGRQKCWEEIKDHLTDARWREVILLLLGSLDGEYCTYLTENILAAGDVTFYRPVRRSLPPHLQLAADALANQAPMSPELQQRIVGGLESIVTYNDIAPFEAIGALGAIRHLPEMVTTPLAAIADTPTVPAGDRLFAARQLRRLGERDKAIATLTDIADDTAVDAVLRVSAVGELERLGERETAMTTLTDLAEDPEVCLGDLVDEVRVLGILDKVGIAFLTALADNIADDIALSYAQWRLVRMLDILGAETAIAFLTRLAADAAGDPLLRESAVRELERLSEAGIAFLTRLAADAAVGAVVRESAVRGLGRSGEAGITSLNALADDFAVDVRTLAYVARKLGHLGEREKAIATLSTIAEDPEVDVRDRVSASRELGRLGEDGIAAMAAIAKNPEIAEADRHRVVDELAGIVLGRNGGAAKTVLTQLARDKAVVPDVRVRSGYRLGRLGETYAAITALTDVVSDPATPAMEKVGAAGAIQEFGGSVEAPIVMMRAGIANLEIGVADRISMAWRLSGLGERDEGIATLAKLANDETVDDINRVKAAWHLGELDASESARPALNLLVAAAEDEAAEPGLRLDAGKVLADLGAIETAIATLTAVANNTDADVDDRIEAAKILGKLGGIVTSKAVLQTIAGDWSLSRANRQDAREALRALRDGQPDSVS